MVQEIAVLLPEGLKQSIEPVLIDLVLISRRALVDRVSIFKCPTGQNGKPDAEHLGERGIDMGWVASLHNKIVVDLFRGQIHIGRLALDAVQQGLKVVELPRQRNRTDDLNLPALVDKDVPRVDVADLLLQQLELIPRPHDVVQQVPHLGLQEVLPQLVPVQDLGLQHELVVIEAQLHGLEGTLTMPLDPQRPTDSKECLRGKRMTSLVYES